MNKKFLLGLLCLGNILFAQNVEKEETNPLSKKGQIFAFWGWNYANYSKSDIRFKGADYNFTLHDVVATDRQTDFTFKTYFNPANITIPQTNAKIGYFIKDKVALVLALDHMKYVMRQGQEVDFSGEIANPHYAAMVSNGKINLEDGEFLKFEHTDGLNYINLGLEKYQNLWDKKNFDVVLGYGGGAGVLLPKTNATLMNNERSDRFHLAGFGLDVRTSLNLVFWKHFLLRAEGKYGYINMPDIKTTLNNKPDKALQDFTFFQFNFGIGYTFNTKK